MFHQILAGNYHFVQLKTFYNKVPGIVKTFLIRAVFIFISWQALYYFVLMPRRVPDRYLSNVTAYSTARLLSLFYTTTGATFAQPGSMRPSSVYVNGFRTLSILDSCNALDIYVLYISFLFCFPGPWKRRLVFILIGIPYILIINTIRCAAIAWLNIAHNDLVDITHHYLFTGVVYVLVFYLWVLYTKKLTSNEA